MLLVTPEPEEFLKQWDHPPSPDYKPKMTTTSNVKRGEQVVGFLLFSGCKVNGSGNCDATVDWLLKKPDGSIYADHKGAELWQGKATPPTGNLQVAVSNLGLRVELTDPLGEYILVARAHDRVAGISIDVETRFTVREAK